MQREPIDPCRRHLLGAATRAVLGAVGLAAGAAQGQSLRRDWPRGTPTPALALAALDGPVWRLAEAGGKVVVLNFWASWCEPCRTEMPSLELLAQRHERDGLVVMAVNHRETDAAIQRFLQLMPITLPILRDADGATSRAWGSRLFPTTVVVGRGGRAAFSVIGECDWTGAEARGWIAPLLKS